MARTRLSCLAALAALFLAALAGPGTAAAAQHSRHHHHARARCTAHRHARGKAGSFHSTHRRRHRCARRHHRRHHAAHHRSRPRSTAADGCANTHLVPNDQNVALVRAATLCLVNRERVDHGERPLDQNEAIQAAAQGHSASMSAAGYFEHTGPGGQTPLSRLRSAGYIYSANIGYSVGENIAWGTGSLSTPAAIVSAWMNSAGHRANILDAAFRDTGVGVSADLPRSMGGGGAGGIYTQDFGVINR